MTSPVNQPKKKYYNRWERGFWTERLSMKNILATQKQQIHYTINVVIIPLDMHKNAY